MRSTSIAFTIVLSAASLGAQRSMSPTQYIAPPSGNGCPVLFSASRLNTPALNSIQTGQQSTHRSQNDRSRALHQQELELQAKRSQAAAQLAQLPVGSDAATTLQLSNQIKGLDEELARIKSDIVQLDLALVKESRTDNAGNPTGQSVQISFHHSPAAIVAVDLTVHGVSMAAHVTPAAQFVPGSDLTEDFHLSGSAAQPVLESDLGTHQPMILTWVELSRIEYANGTSWQKSAMSRCAAAPSLLVLVDR